MSREVHVRFCESLGVQFPGATHPYGFRPGRSQHQALDALSYALLKKKVNYVLDADIRGFLDSSSHCSYG
jgi:retron-type reverse transcriptase